jgi:hypothetical protein
MFEAQDESASATQTGTPEAISILFRRRGDECFHIPQPVSSFTTDDQAAPIDVGAAGGEQPC